MLGKLYKYDFRCTARKAVPIFLLYTIIGVTLRIMMEVNIESKFLAIIATLIVTVFEFMMMLLVLFTLVTTIGRINKNLFTDEGYLMHTLPVKPSAHIWSKTLNLVTWGVISFLVTIIGALIVFADADFENVKRFFRAIPELNTPITVTLVLIALVVLFCLGIIAIYGVTSGAMENSMPIFKKGIVKVITGVVIYFLVVYVMLYGFEFIDWLTVKLSIDGDWVLAFGLSCVLVFLTIVGAGLFALANFLMKKKLNMQ